MCKLLSFDVYGTLVNTPPTNAKAFRIILEEAGAPNIDALAFYQFWESRNIVHYRELLDGRRQARPRPELRLLAARYGAPAGQPGRSRKTAAQYRYPRWQQGAHRVWQGPGAGGEEPGASPGARA